MHRHQIVDMVASIQQAFEEKLGELEPEDLVAIQVGLERYWRTRIAHTWTVGDVKDYANDLGYNLDDHSCLHILKMMFRRCDASTGINWDTIDTTIDWFLRNEKE
jgi:hypothetical protein